MASDDLPQLARDVPALRAALEAQRAEAAAQHELLLLQAAMLEGASTRTHELLGHAGPWRACAADPCAGSRAEVDAARGPVAWTPPAESAGIEEHRDGRTPCDDSPPSR